MVEATKAQPPVAETANDGSKTSNTDNKPFQQKSSRRSRQRANTKSRKEGNTIAHIPKEKFTGRSDDLQGFIYDVVTSRGGIAYTRTTKEIARHVGEKHTTIGSYLRTAIMTLSVPAPTRPTAPIPVGVGTPPMVDAVEQEIFTEKRSVCT
jgi:hypothetical protein